VVRLLSKRKLATVPNSASILFNEKVFARLLCHPHIGAITDVIESAAQLFQVMKFYPNRDLAAVLAGGRLDRHTLLAIFDEILSAVEYCHSTHFCHLDIKPENVLLTNGLHAKLVDWAFAVPCFEPVSGQTCGSLGYVAPEVLTGQPFDGRKADIFSLGICLYFMFTGQPPAEDTRTLHESVIDWDGISRDAAELIRRMLRRNPAERPDVSDVRSDPIFAALSERPMTYRPIDIEPPVSSIAAGVLRQLADLLSVDSEWLRGRLSEDAPNREKVLFYLAEACPRDAESSSVARDDGPLGWSKSLPVGALLSSSHPFIGQSCFETTVSDSRHVIVRVVLDHLISQKFLVSPSQSGTWTCVLNRESGDVCLDVEVTEPEQRRCIVVVPDMAGTGAGALGDLDRFLARHFV
jgi:serine/threonine protein kinase